MNTKNYNYFIDNCLMVIKMTDTLIFVGFFCFFFIRSKIKMQIFGRYHNGLESDFSAFPISNTKHVFVDKYKHN